MLRIANHNAFPVESNLSLFLMPTGAGGGRVPLADTAHVPAPVTVPPFSAAIVALHVVGRGGDLSLELGHQLARPDAGVDPWSRQLPAAVSVMATITADGDPSTAADLYVSTRSAGPWSDPDDRTIAYLAQLRGLGTHDVHVGLRLDNRDPQPGGEVHYGAPTFPNLLPEAGDE